MNIILKNPIVTLDGTSMSAFAKACDINIDVPIKDRRNLWCHSGQHFVPGGTLVWGMTFVFNQSFDDGEVDSLLWAMLRRLVLARVRPRTGAITRSNPSYEGDVILVGYSPLSSAVGELVEVQATFQGSDELERKHN